MKLKNWGIAVHLEYKLYFWNEKGSRLKRIVRKEVLDQSTNLQMTSHCKNYRQRIGGGGGGVKYHCNKDTLNILKTNAPIWSRFLLDLVTAYIL